MKMTSDVVDNFFILRLCAAILLLGLTILCEILLQLPNCILVVTFIDASVAAEVGSLNFRQISQNVGINVDEKILVNEEAFQVQIVTQQRTIKRGEQIGLEIELRELSVVDESFAVDRLHLIARQ